MHPIFQIISPDIQALNDEQARELVARLCKAELLSKGVGTGSVTWGGDQRAKDGGVDIRVDIIPGKGISGYIPRDATAYQVKAEKFNKAKIPVEMAPKDVLRNAIPDLSKKSGAYIIVSTKDFLSDSSLMVRKEAMTECLEKHGLVGSVHLDFYDSRKIACWVENFPAIVIWVRSILGKPLDGWQPYAPWAYKETNIGDEYLLDEKNKIFVPNSENGINVTDAIDQIRRELVNCGASIRIVGLSGVGKTRFAQALFDNRITTTNVGLNQENVLYTDLSNDPTPKPIAMLEGLNSEKTDCVVIVDNCSQDTHQKLTEIVRRPNCMVRLITIEYDIRDNLPEDTICYRIEGVSDEVLAKLLKRNYQVLSELDIRKIVDFSDGNVRVAYSLASTSEIKGELAQLTDDALFRRLFIQRHGENEELLKCAEAASLLYSINVEDMSEKSELAVLAKISEVSIQTFYRNIAELQRRGLVQERGKWRAVLPHAISNRLAFKALDSIPPSILIDKFVISSSQRVARSFSRRLGFLHESKIASNIANEWLQPEGILGDVTQLNELQRQMFVNIAPINQRAALDALMRAVRSKDFISISNPNRSQFARLLRLLAYEKNLFEDAIDALLMFALEEPEEYKSNSTREILKSLFYSYLSGTEALPEQRAIFVKTLAFSDDERRQNLALTLLHAGLEANHFSCIYGFEFGALKRNYGWYPKDGEEIKKWYGLFIDISVELGKNLTTSGLSSRSLLGRSFRSLWTNVNMREALTGAAKELAIVDGWPDGWIGTRSTLIYEKTTLDSDSMNALRNLEKVLAPKNLLEKIQAKVLSRAFGIELDDLSESVSVNSVTNSIKTAQEEAETLGKAAALDGNALDDLLPYITAYYSNEKSWYFGFGIGQKALLVQKILNRIKLIIAEKITVGLNILFIRGLIAGWNKTNPVDVAKFLDEALYDDIWGPMFPELQVCIELDEVAHTRIIKCLEIGKAPSWQFRALILGQITDNFSVEQLGSILRLLTKKPDNGLDEAFNVICEVVLCLDNKSSVYRSELQKFCLKLIEELNWALIDLQKNNFEYKLVNLIEFVMVDSKASKEASKVLKNLISFEISNTEFYPRRLGKILMPFFKHFPEEALNACYVRDIDGSYDSVLRILCIPFDEFGDTAVGVVAEENLIKWCKSSLDDRCIFAAQTCKLYENSNISGLDEQSSLSISYTAKSVLAHAPDKKKVLDIFVDRSYSTNISESAFVANNQKLQLLDQLNPTDELKLRNFIKGAKVIFTQKISRQEEMLKRWNRPQTASFE